MPTRLYVGNLDYRASERDVQRFFYGYGRILRLTLKVGYCFVDFENRQDAEKAVRSLNGQKLMERRLLVEFSRSNQRFPSSGGQRRSRSRETSGRHDRTESSSSAETESNVARRSRSRSGSSDIDRGEKEVAVHCDNCNKDPLGCECNCNICRDSFYDDDEAEMEKYANLGVHWKDRPRIRKAPYVKSIPCDNTGGRAEITPELFKRHIKNLFGSAREVGKPLSIDVAKRSSDFKEAVRRFEKCPCGRGEYPLTRFFGVDGEFTSDSRPYNRWNDDKKFLVQSPPDPFKKGPFIRWLSVAHVCGRVVVFDMSASRGFGELRELFNESEWKLISWAGHCDAYAIKLTFGFDQFEAMYDLQANWLNGLANNFRHSGNTLGAMVDDVLALSSFDRDRQAIIEQERDMKFKQFWNLPTLTDDKLRYAAADAVATMDAFHFFSLKFPSFSSWADVDEQLISTIIQRNSEASSAGARPFQVLSSASDVSSDDVVTAVSTAEEPKSNTEEKNKNDDGGERLKRKRSNPGNVEMRRKRRRQDQQKWLEKRKNEWEHLAPNKRPASKGISFPWTNFVSFSSADVEKILGRLRETSRRQSADLRLNDDEISSLKEIIDKDDAIDFSSRHAEALGRALQWDGGDLIPVLEMFQVAILDKSFNEFYFNSKSDRGYGIIDRLCNLIELADSSSPVRGVVCRIFANVVGGGESGRRILLTHNRSVVSFSWIGSCLDSPNKEIQLAAASALQNFSFALSPKTNTVKHDRQREEKKPKIDCFRWLIQKTQSIEPACLEQDTVHRLLKTLLTFLWRDLTLVAVGKDMKLVDVVQRLKEAATDRRCHALAETIERFLN